MQQTTEYVNEIHIPITVDISIMKSRTRKIATITPHSSRYLNPQRVDFEASSTFLENESFKKNGKSGKSFYYLHVASTVRWLSTTSSAEITNRIGIITTSSSENITCKEEAPLPGSTMFHQREEEIIGEEHCGNIESETSISTLPQQSASPGAKLPPIPSFSQFVNSSESKETQPNESEEHSHKKLEENMKKRMRLQLVERPRMCVTLISFCSLWILLQAPHCQCFLNGGQRKRFQAHRLWRSCCLRIMIVGGTSAHLLLRKVNLDEVSAKVRTALGRMPSSTYPMWTLKP